MSRGLLGDKFSEILVMNKDGEKILSPQAGKFIPLDQGTIYLWPDSLQYDIQNMPYFQEVIDRQFRQIKGQPRSVARANDPVEDVFDAMFKLGESDVLFAGQYLFSTRNSIMDYINANKSKIRRDQISRINSQLIEYGCVEVLAESKGRKPALLLVVYPFPQINVKIEPRVEVVTPVVSVPEGLPVVNGELEGHVFRALIRQIAHRGRPHEHIDQEGNQVKTHKGVVLVRREEDGSRFTLSIESTVNHNSEVAVMNKVDDELYQQLLNWCRSVQRSHYKRTGCFLEWYIIEPKSLALYFGYKRARADVLDDIRQLIERWLQTTLAIRIESDAVSGAVNEDGDVLGALIRDTELRQFIKHERYSERLSNGTERLVALKFQLPDDTEKGIRMSAMGDRDNDDTTGNLPKVIANGPILRDSLALAMSAFFNNQARLYRKEPWSAPLMEGLEEVFDFDLSDPPSSVKGAQRKKLKDANNIRFNNLLFNFFDRFTDDPEAMREIWLGTKGGTIQTNRHFPECVLIITLNPRKAKTVKKTGKVTVFYPNQREVLHGTNSNQAGEALE